MSFSPSTTRFTPNALPGGFSCTSSFTASRYPSGRVRTNIVSMQRSWMERALAALMAVWFVFATIEPAALHSCPMHGPHGAGHVASAAADHAAGAAHHVTDGGRETAPQHCTCLGDCAGVTPSA